MSSQALINVELSDIKLFKKGKVRDIYQIGNKLLIITTDRISAFDVVIPDGIPQKGEVLTQLSLFWFEFTKYIIDNHLITSDIDDIISLDEKLKKYKDVLKDRSMLVKKTEPIPIECVVRGYLAGSGWKEYEHTGKIQGVNLPTGLKESEELPEVIFTPSTKAEQGHDKTITEQQASQVVGDEIFNFIKQKSIQVYKKARDFAHSKGIIIADTKFEFGKIDDKIILIDEILTPDSSRFWPELGYKTGRKQESFDKQFTRDYLDSLDWDKKPPAPHLPNEIIKATQNKYLKILQMITGRVI